MLFKNVVDLRAMEEEELLEAELLNAYSGMSDKNSQRGQLSEINESDELNIIDESEKLLREIRKEIEYEETSSEFEDYFSFIWNWLDETAENVVYEDGDNEDITELNKALHVDGYRVDPKDNNHRRSLASSLSDLSINSDVTVERVESWSRTFEKFISDPLGLRCFQEFLKTEFSEENLQFWIACEEFQRINDENKLQESANNIFIEYLSQGAPFLVNVTQQAVELAQEKIKAPTADMFIEAQRQVYQLMKQDSYMRFLKSELYNECLVAEDECRPLPFEDEVDENKKEKTGWSLRKSKSRVDELQDSEKKRSLITFLSKGKSGKTLETPLKERSVSVGSSTEMLWIGNVAQQTNGLATPIKHNEELWDGQNTKITCSFVRVILPDGTSAMIVVEKEKTIRKCLTELCEQKSMTLTTYDVFVGREKQTYDLDSDISLLVDCVIYLERRVLFRFDLPNNRSVGVKANPHKTLADVLEPILCKNGFSIGDYTIHVLNTKASVALNINISAVENKRLITRPLPRKSEKSPNVSSKPPFAERASFRRFRGSSFRDDKRGHSRGDEPMDRGRKGSINETRTGDKEKLSRKLSNEMKHLLLGRSKSAEDDGTQALLNVLQKSQIGRIDDQRGMIPKNLELPDFLKTTASPVPPITSITKAQTKVDFHGNLLPEINNPRDKLHYPSSPLIFDADFGEPKSPNQLSEDSSFKTNTLQTGLPSVCSVRSWRDIPSPEKHQFVEICDEKVDISNCLTGKLSKSDSVLLKSNINDMSKQHDQSVSSLGRDKKLREQMGNNAPLLSTRDTELAECTDSLISNKLCSWRCENDSFRSTTNSNSLSRSLSPNLTFIEREAQCSPDSGLYNSCSVELTIPRTPMYRSSLDLEYMHLYQKDRPRPIQQQDQIELLRGLAVEGYDVIQPLDRQPEEVIISNVPKSQSSHFDQSFPNYTSPKTLDKSVVYPARTSSPFNIIRQELFIDDASSPPGSVDSSRKLGEYGSTIVDQKQERITFV